MAITSAPGQDGITASIYNEYADQLNYPIQKWQDFLKSGKLPQSTNQAVITSIYRGGVKKNQPSQLLTSSIN